MIRSRHRGLRRVPAGLVTGIASAFASLAIVSIAQADGDRAEELRAQARQRAAAAAAQQRAAEHRAEQAQAQAGFERRYVGPAAQGRSDAEVHALCERKIADARARGEAARLAAPGMLAQAEAMQRRAADPATKAKADAGARLAGAQSMSDLADLSEADLQKLQADLERRQVRP